MADHLTKQKRSWIMSRIRSKDTKPELIVRSILHRLGYRFRLHQKDLPGKPDIVLPKYKTVIFVHGCFWHRHVGCKKTRTPKSNLKFWKKKFKTNRERDRNNIQALKTDNWKTIIVWECELEKIQKISKTMQRIINQFDPN